MAALLLAWTWRHPGDLEVAVEKAVAGLQAVLKDTARAAGAAVQATERTSEVRWQAVPAWRCARVGGARRAVRCAGCACRGTCAGVPGA